MANSVDPDQTSPSGAVWSGSALFAYVILSETLVFGILGLSPYWFLFMGLGIISTNSVTSYLLFCTLTAFCKEVYSKRKEFAPTGSKFFPFRVNHFWSEVKNNSTEICLKSVLIPLKILIQYVLLFFKFKNLSRQTLLIINFCPKYFDVIKVIFWVPRKVIRSLKKTNI